MQYFTELFVQLDRTTKTLDKIRALISYFQKAQDKDKLWAIALLSHRRPKRTVNTTLLRQWAAEECGIPEWLFEEAHHVVGDLAETITAVLPDPEGTSEGSLSYWINYIIALEPLPVEQKKEKIRWAWKRLKHHERFVFNKLITGGFRMGVSQLLMVKALSKYTAVNENVLSHRLMGKWSPENITFSELVFAEGQEHDISKPYPFYLAYPLQIPPENLDCPDNWQAERKWDGIRGQIVCRKGEIFVWSRGEELVTDKYPEYQVLRQLLPDGTVLDGEILPVKNEVPMSFNFLQTRIGRKVLNAKILKEVPISFVAYDLLETGYQDLRMQPLRERRYQLEQLLKNITSDVIRISPVISFNSWDDLKKEREQSRQHFSEGIMLKHKDSPYRSGRRRGEWWKWKVDPLAIDAVMIYAMRGHGRRANLYTDYTFAVWDDDKLVPFTKAYSGLVDEEIKRIDRWIKLNTIGKFGPVRSVKPQLVFEIAFEGIAKSSRHKSGIALRFPRMNRWRHDKTAREANSLEDLKALLLQYGNK